MTPAAWRLVVSLTRLRSACRGWSCLWVGVGLWLVPGCTCGPRTWWGEQGNCQRLYRQALDYEAQGEFGESVRLLESAVVENPEDAEARWELARVLLEHDQVAAALVHLQYLVENHPDDARAFVSLARTLVERQRWDDASKLIDLALDIDCRSTEALLLRGGIEEARGQWDRALETYHQVLLEQPGEPTARVRIAALMLEQNDPRSAAAMLREISQEHALDPQVRGDVYRLLGRAYAQLQRWPEAVVALDSASGLGPLSAQEAYELAYARSQVGDWRGTRVALELALERQPSFEAAELLLSQIPADPSALSQEILPAAGIQPNRNP